MKVIIALLTFLSTACNSVVTKKEQVGETVKINKEAETFPLSKISFPLKNSCGMNLPVYADIDVLNLVQDSLKNLKFGGVLRENKKYLAILLIDTYADSQLHYLTTISRQGVIIDKFNLFSADCIEEEFFVRYSNYKIDQDLVIIQTDSSAEYKRDVDGQIIKESILTSLHNYKYFVDEEGKIKKYSE